MSGLEFVQGLVNGAISLNTIAQTLGYDVSEAVWHRRGWRSYWRCRSKRGAEVGRRPIAPELRALIGHMAIRSALDAARQLHGTSDPVDSRERRWPDHS
jgi:hypothetical protein